MNGSAKAISPMIERFASGLVHILLSTSLQYTPLAALSRPVAGTIGKSLVVTLPGSPKAVRENLNALLDHGLIAHALDLIRGGSGKDVHMQLVAGELASSNGIATQLNPTLHDHSHPHHHSHHHHDHHAPTPHTLLSNDPNLPSGWFAFCCIQASANPVF